MSLETKTFQGQIKSIVREGDVGAATALVAVYNNVDLGKDRIMPGAFDYTLGAWLSKGDPIPVIWSHMWDDPHAHIGWIEPKDAVSTDQGLEVKMQFDLGRPMADQVFHLLKNRRITQFSFGYTADKYNLTEDPQHGQVRDLLQVSLFEVGPTLLGMNPETQLYYAASAVSGSRRKAAAATIEVPGFIKANAKRGLAYYEDGKGGDGLMPRTIREARAMAKGEITADKAKRMAAWFARHKTDLKAPANSDPSDPKYPAAGLVAWLLWGGDANGSDRAQKWAEKQVAAASQDGKSGSASIALDTKETPQMDQTTEDLAGSNAYGIPNYLAAVDAAIDAAQTLLEQIKDADAIAEQVYGLLVAADAALDPIMDALGVPDPDEDPAEDANETQPTTSSDAMKDAPPRDTQGTIDLERIFQLLTRTKH